MKPKLSIILPSIRHTKVSTLIRSIKLPFPFEIILVSPSQIQTNFIGVENIKHFVDLGSPVRASQIAACLAEGELLTWISDDARLDCNVLEQACMLLSQTFGSEVVCTKYLEGDNQPFSIDYFKINTHDSIRSKFIPSHYWIFNTAIIKRKNFEKLGGFNCRYETTSFAATDLAIRAQYTGIKLQFLEKELLFCEHGQNDHKPIEDAFNQNDLPLYHSFYNQPNWISNIYINMDNWKKSENKWRRFK